MLRRVLALCGLASSALYVATDLIGALCSPGYDYTGQAISEMSAGGAPTTSLLAPFYVAYALLFTAFGLSLWPSGDPRNLRISGILLVAVGLLGLFAWPFFPMHMRGAERTFSDTMHLALGGIDVLLLAAAIVFASGAFGRIFRAYSWATIAAMLLFGGITSLYVPNVDAGLPTPLLGVFERLSLAAYLVWIAVFSLKLSRSEPERSTARSAASAQA